MAGLVSCEDYLDVSRETTEITEEDIFTNYLETRKYLNEVYTSIYIFAYSPIQNVVHNYWWLMYPQAASEEYIHPGTSSGTPLLGEELWFNEDYFESRFADGRQNHNFWPFWQTPWMAIRVANKIIEKADLIEDATQEQIDVLKGQAYYGRAFSYHYLLTMHGGMPYIVNALKVGDKIDRARLSYDETAQMIMADLDTAATLLPTNWLIPQLSDPYATEDYGRYTSVTAKALKGRIALYNASPLSYFADEQMGYAVNQNEQERWEQAAEICWEAIEFAEANGYALEGGDSVTYRQIFRGQWSSLEYLHILNQENRALAGGHQVIGSPVSNWSLTRMFIPGAVMEDMDDRNRGVGVTQEMVDKFEAVETDGSGNIVRALDINDARDEGFYNDQNPYINRDPRFRYDVIYHQSLKPGYGPDGTDGSWNFDRGTITAGKYNDDFDKNSQYHDNQTGYYTRKYWHGGSKILNNIIEPWPWIVMRMAELYLNYAEAANQAYGPGGAAPGASLTAADAVNLIRNRVGMPDVDTRYMGSKEIFHERIMNERGVELCFEWIHNYVDVRRWRKIETEEYQSSPHVIWITEEAVSAEYPTGYKYEVRPYSVNGVRYQRTFNLRHYFMPVSKSDVQKTLNFNQNPGY